MAAIQVNKTLDAPIDDVFELLSDHAGYTRFRGFSHAEVVREGTQERNGVGCVRRLAAGPLRFDEEIIAFERPTRMDYLILDVNVPLAHDGGSIRLTPEGARTAVDWRSTFSVPIPLAGPPIAALLAVALKRGFIRLLEDIERAARGAG